MRRDFSDLDVARRRKSSTKCGYASSKRVPMSRHPIRPYHDLRNSLLAGHQRDASPAACAFIDFVRCQAVDA